MKFLIRKKYSQYGVGAALILFVLTSFLFAPLLEAQRRGSSFGGSRGGSTFRSSPSPSSSRPSYAPSSPAAPRGNSFGGSRSAAPAPSSAMGSGASMNYRKSYGLPRKSEPMNAASPSSSYYSSSPYMVHSYGGYGDGLMMGYMMGRTSAMWSTPFHPAYYYSQPTIIRNPDGSIAEAYPPTFSFFKFFITLAVVVLIIWLVMRFIRRRRGGGGSDNMSQSSFA